MSDGNIEKKGHEFYVTKNYVKSNLSISMGCWKGLGKKNDCI